MRFLFSKLLIIIIIGQVVITILFRVSSLFVDIGKEGFFSIGQRLSRDAAAAAAAKKLELIFRHYRSLKLQSSLNFNVNWPKSIKIWALQDCKGDPNWYIFTKPLHWITNCNLQLPSFGRKSKHKSLIKAIFRILKDFQTPVRTKKVFQSGPHKRTF